MDWDVCEILTDWLCDSVGQSTPTQDPTIRRPSSGDYLWLMGTRKKIKMCVCDPTSKQQWIIFSMVVCGREQFEMCVCVCARFQPIVACSYSVSVWKTKELAVLAWESRAGIWIVKGHSHRNSQRERERERPRENTWENQIFLHNLKNRTSFIFFFTCEMSVESRPSS